MGTLLLEPSQRWLQWQELVTLHTSSGQPGLALTGLYGFCACAAHLSLSWRGGQEKGAVGPFLEGEGCCSEPGRRQQPSVLALPPWREEPFRQGHPSSPVLPCQCPGTSSDTVPAPCPACSTCQPCTQQAGAATAPALAALQVSAPLLRQSCVRWRWLVVDDCRGHAEGLLQALLLFQLREGRGRESECSRPKRQLRAAGQRDEGVGDTGVKQKGRQGCLQRSILQCQEDVPAVLCTQGIWTSSDAAGPGSEGDSGRSHVVPAQRCGCPGRWPAMPPADDRAGPCPTPPTPLPQEGLWSPGKSSDNRVLKENAFVL